MNIAGTEIDPRRFNLERKQVVTDEERRKVIESADEALGKWTAYLQTQAGITALELAAPRIEELDKRLGWHSAVVMRLFGLTSVEEANELRAEWRGEKKVWLTLISEPERLRRNVTEQLEKGGGKGSGKGVSWTPLPKK